MKEEKSLNHIKNTGKIVFENGEYFLEVGNDSHAHKEVGSVSAPHKIALGPVAETVVTKEMVGKSVELIMSTDSSPAIVGIKMLNPKIFFLCYKVSASRMTIPIIEDKVRASIAKQLLIEKVITKDEYERMV